METPQRKGKAYPSPKILTASFLYTFAQFLDIKLALDKALKGLKKRENYILNERFVVGKTQMELAEELGISQAQISRIEKGAINSIKKLIR